MKVYLGKDRQHVTQDMTATHATMKELTGRVEGPGHNLCMHKFFLSSDLFDDLTKSKINCCGTVRPNRKGVPQDLGYKRLKLKKGDMTAVVW
jgi:hypothetical protein